MNISLRRGLDPQAALVNSGRELHVESLLDRLEKIHDKMMRDVEPAQRQHVFVVGPFAFHHFHLEPLFLEEPFLDRAEDRRFAGQANVTDANFIRSNRAGGIPLATGQNQRTKRRNRDESC